MSKMENWPQSEDCLDPNMPFLKNQLRNLPIPRALVHRFWNYKYLTIADVMEATDEQLLACPYIGRKGIAIIRKAISIAQARYLGPHIEEDPFIGWCLRHKELLETLRRELRR